MKKTKKFLVCASAIFAMLLVACTQPKTKSSETPASSAEPTTSVVDPSSSKPTPTSSTPAPTSSSEVHVCEHTCPKCGGCKDPDCTDPVCAEKCVCDAPKPIPSFTLAYDTNNNFLVECEDTLVEGKMTSDNPSDGFVYDRESNNPAHPTSGGKCVINWAANGNAIKWNVVAAEAEENVRVTFWVTCAFSQSSANLGFKVNEKSYAWEEATVEGKGSQNLWYYWNEIHTTINLAKGENTFVITNKGTNESWNLDCIILTKYVAPTHVCEHKCDVCGGCTDPDCTDPACATKCAGHTYMTFDANGRYRVEAEDYKSFTGGVVINDNDKSSGGKEIGGFSYPATTTYEILTEQAYENVRLEACYGLGMNDNENGAIEVNVNGDRVHGRGWTQETHPANDNIGMTTTGWACDAIGATNDFNLKKGKNTIKLVSPYGSAANIDYFEILRADATEPHRCTSVCPICRKCTNPDCTDPACATKCQGHGGKFENGILRLEVEDGQLGGGAEVFTQGTDETLSGGKGVGNFYGSASVKLQFTNDVERYAYAEIRYALGQCSNDNQAVELCVNGGKIHGEIDNIGTNNANGWHTWDIGTSKLFYLPAGDITIELKAPFGSAANLDYVELHANETLQFTDGVARIEVESGELAGGCVVSNPVDGETLSGGHGVGDFYGSASVTLKAYVAKETYVIADICYALGQCSNDNQAVELCVNGGKIHGEIDNIGTNNANGWHTWEIGSSKLFKLNPGENTIVLKVPYGSAANLDYIDLKQQNVVSFTDGSARLEVEDGQLAGGCVVSNPIDGETLSGGHGVGDFNGSASVTLKFTVMEEVTVYAEIRYALGMCESGNQAVELYVNDAKVKGQIDNIGTNDDHDNNGWHTWELGVSKQFTLRAGENTIVLKAPYNSYTNLDYIDLIKPNAALAFADGTAKLECETGVLAGGCGIGNNDAASEGQLVGAWEQDSCTITFNIYVETDIKVTAAMMACCWGDPGSNGVAELYLNGTRIDGAEDHMVRTITGGEYHTYGMTASTKAFTLKAGNNTIMLKHPWAVGANLDYLLLTEVAE